MSPLWTGIIITIVGALFATTLSVTVASWISTKKKLAELDVEVTKLRQRMDAQEKTCQDRLEWQRKNDEKISECLVHIAEIKGMLVMHFQQKKP